MCRPPTEEEYKLRLEETKDKYRKELEAYENRELKAKIEMMRSFIEFPNNLMKKLATIRNNNSRD